MKNKSPILLLFIILATLLQLHCKKTAPPPPTLRIWNSTPFNMTDCIFDPFNTLSENPTTFAHNYGNIPKDSLTGYHEFPSLYRYSWINVTMDNKLYRVRPYDYFHEELYKTGIFTYKLSINPFDGNLKIDFTKD